MSERTFSRILDEDPWEMDRQNLVSEIEEKLEMEIEGEKEVGVTTYISDHGYPLLPDDTKGFEDMLRDVRGKDVIFLIIDSPGGDAETALRVIRLYRQATDSFRTIVPDMAKSAATQICLGSEMIYMGRNSELGPIDPLIRVGNQRTRAETILKAVKNLPKWQEEWDLPPIVLNAIAGSFSPDILQQAQDAMEYIENRATEIAQGMVDSDEEAKEIVKSLMSSHTHSRSIDIKEAKRIGLEICDLRDSEDPELWDMIWNYYLRAVAFCRSETQRPTKLMDTSEESMVIV